MIGEHSDIKICNANDYQLAARSILPKPLYEYLASGTDDEQTLTENVSCLQLIISFRFNAECMICNKSVYYTSCDVIM